MDVGRGSFCYKFEKNEGVRKTCEHIRCDNAVEHMSELRKICEGEYGIQLEYTAPIHHNTTVSWNGCFRETQSVRWL